VKPFPLIRIVLQKGSNDCGIAALASALGLSYEAVEKACEARHIYLSRRKSGLRLKELESVASYLGFKPERDPPRGWDQEDDRVGLVKVVFPHEKIGHYVLVSGGVVLDPDGWLWDARLFLRHLGARFATRLRFTEGGLS